MSDLKLSDLNPDDIEPVQPKSSGLKLSDLSSDDVEVQAPEAPSELESAGRGALQGATLGYSDEAIGGLKAGGAKLTGNKESLKDLYKQYRDLERQKNDLAQKTNPKSYLAGNIGGGLAGLALAPEMGAVKAGALMGLGTSNADLTNPTAQNLGKAAVDTGIGAVLGKGSELVGQGIKNIFNPESLESTANEATNRAVGLKASKELTSEYNPETGHLEQGSDIVKDTGLTALKEGALPMTGGAKNIYDKSLEAINNQYEKLNPLLSSTQAKLNQNVEQNIEQIGHLSDKAGHFLEQFEDSLETNPDRDSIVQNLYKKYGPYIEQMGQSDGDLNALNTFKKSLQDKATDLAAAAYDNPASELKPEAAFVKRLGGIVRQHIEDLANSADQGAGDQIKDLNNTLGRLYDYKDAAKKLLNKPSSTIGSKDLVTSGLGYLAGGPLGAITSEAAKLGLEKTTGNTIGRLGNMAIAKSAFGASKALSTPVGEIVQKAIPAVAQVGQKTINNPFSIQQAQKFNPVHPSAPESRQAPATQIATNLYNATDDSLRQIASSLSKEPGLKSYGENLNKAIEMGDSGAKNRAVFLIMQNPQSRSLVTPEKK